MQFPSLSVAPASFRRKSLSVVISLAALSGVDTAWAQDDEIEEVVVWGRSLQLLIRRLVTLLKYNGKRHWHCSTNTR
jgi:hypothetical protein